MRKSPESKFATFELYEHGEPLTNNIERTHFPKKWVRLIPMFRQQCAFNVDTWRFATFTKFQRIKSSIGKWNNHAAKTRNKY